MVRVLRQLTLFVLTVGTSVVLGWLLMDQLERNKQLEAPEDIPLPLKRPSTGHVNGNSHQPTGAISPSPAAKAETSEATGINDDLTVIVGIGPVYEKALHDLGVITFAALAEQDPDDLAQRMHTRVTADRIREEDWIGQAKQLSQSAK
ncbi:MAG: helix-hairpin-helix domain-containing protein [Chloroflexota bacterium]